MSTPEEIAAQEDAELKAMESAIAEKRARAEEAKAEAKRSDLSRLNAQGADPYVRSVANLLQLIEALAKQAGVPTGKETPFGVAYQRCRDALGEL